MKRQTVKIIQEELSRALHGARGLKLFANLQRLAVLHVAPFTGRVD